MMRARQIVATSGLIAVVVWTAGARVGAQEKPAAPAKRRPPSAASNAGQVARGRLVVGHGCNDCHTPYKMGDNGPSPT